MISCYLPKNSFWIKKPIIKLDRDERNSCYRFIYIFHRSVYYLFIALAKCTQLRVCRKPLWLVVVLS